MIQLILYIALICFLIAAAFIMFAMGFDVLRSSSFFEWLAERRATQCDEGRILWLYGPSRAATRQEIEEEIRRRNDGAAPL